MNAKILTEQKMADFLSGAGYDILKPEVIDPAMVCSIAASLGYKQKKDRTGMGFSFVLKEVDPGQESATPSRLTKRTALGQNFVYGIPVGVPPTHVDLCECNWCENKVIVELGEEICPVCGKDGFLKEVSSDFPYESITAILKDSFEETAGIRYKYLVAWEITQNGTTEVEAYSMEEAKTLVESMQKELLQKHVDNEELHVYQAEESGQASADPDDAPLKKYTVDTYLELNGAEEVETKSAEAAMKIVREADYSSRMKTMYDFFCKRSAAEIAEIATKTMPVIN